MASPVAIAYSGASPSTLGDIAVTTTTPLPVTVSGAGTGTSALAAGEAFIGQVGAPGDLIIVTPTLDTNAYAIGDLLFDWTAIANAVRVSGGRAILQSIHILDEDDQGIGMDILFGTAGTPNTLGTANSGPSISDANARAIRGRVRIDTADYIDLGGSRIATKTGIGLSLKAVATTLWFGGITVGAPTYTAAGLQFAFGLIWD